MKKKYAVGTVEGPIHFMANTNGFFDTEVDTLARVTYYYTLSKLAFYEDPISMRTLVLLDGVWETVPTTGASQFRRATSHLRRKAGRLASASRVARFTRSFNGPAPSFLLPLHGE